MTGSYLLKNDGTKIYGSIIVWQSGLILKDQIKIDNQKFKSSEIIGYKKEDTYYGRFGGEYIKRIVHGKINVYVKFSQVNSMSTDRNGFAHARTYTRTDQYGQLGETGPMIFLAGQKEIKEMVKDCPAAYALADLSDKRLGKAIKADNNYLNKIFDLYNNDCK